MRVRGDVATPTLVHARDALRVRQPCGDPAKDSGGGDALHDLTVIVVAECVVRVPTAHVQREGGVGLPRVER